VKVLLIRHESTLNKVRTENLIKTALDQLNLKVE